MAFDAKKFTRIFGAVTTAASSAMGVATEAVALARGSQTRTEQVRPRTPKRAAVLIEPGSAIMVQVSGVANPYIGTLKSAKKRLWRLDCEGSEVVIVAARICAWMLVSDDG